MDGDLDCINTFDGINICRLAVELYSVCVWRDDALVYFEDCWLGKEGYNGNCGDEAGRVDRK